jgi:hypothetical protein
LPSSFAYFWLLERTCSHSAYGQGDLVSAVVAAESIRFGRLAISGCGCVLLHERRLLVDFRKVGVAQAMLHRLGSDHDGVRHAEAELYIKPSVLSNREFLMFFQVPLHCFLRVEHHKFETFEDAFYNIVD